MKTSRYLKLSIVAITALTLGLSGCGSSNDDTSSSTSTSTSTSTQEGIFVDAPVLGLHYQTATQSGFTDAKGTFKYLAGETVEFKLGNLSLGNVDAVALVTPYTIAGDTNLSNPSNKATNIALLLQNFDASNDDNASIDISKLANYDFSDYNLSAEPNTIEDKIAATATEIQTNLGNDYFKTTFSIKNTDTVTSAMQTSVEETSVVDINSILNIKYTSIMYSTFTGSKEYGTTTFTSEDQIVFEEGSSKFEKINNSTLKMIWDEDYINYFHFLTTTKEYATICSTRDENANCVVPTMYLATDDATKNNLLKKTSIFTEPTPVTSLDELRGKLLYQLGGSDVADAPFSFIAKRLEDNDNITFFTWNISANSNHETNTSTAYTETDGTLSLTSDKKIILSSDEDHKEGTNTVKYALTGKTVSMNELKNDIYGFDRSDLPDINGSVTFTKGNIYCGYIYDECWLNQDAFDEFKDAFYLYNQEWE